MELVEGGVLTAWAPLRRARRGRRILQAAQEVMEALAHLHAQGILHRDLTPKNILLTKEGKARPLVGVVTAVRQDDGMGPIPGSRTLQPAGVLADPTALPAAEDAVYIRLNAGFGEGEAGAADTDVASLGLVGTGGRRPSGCLIRSVIVMLRPTASPSTW